MSASLRRGCWRNSGGKAVPCHGPFPCRCVESEQAEYCEMLLKTQEQTDKAAAESRPIGNTDSTIIVGCFQRHTVHDSFHPCSHI